MSTGVSYKRRRTDKNISRYLYVYIKAIMKHILMLYPLCCPLYCLFSAGSGTGNKINIIHICSVFQEIIEQFLLQMDHHLP